MRAALLAVGLAAALVGAMIAAILAILGVEVIR